MIFCKMLIGFFNKNGYFLNEIIIVLKNFLIVDVDLIFCFLESVYVCLV